MTTSSKFVALLDMLGFSAMVANLDHQALHQVYENMVGNAALAISQGNFRTIETPLGRRSIADISLASVRLVIFSDSVVIYSLNEGQRSFIDVCAAAGHMMVAGFYTGLPMRGGISFGLVTEFNATNAGVLGVHGVLGRPLVEAYLLEQGYRWAGCVVSDSAINQFEASPRAASEPVALSDLEQSGLLSRYGAPRKDGNNPDAWVINWPRLNRGGISSNAVHTSFLKHGKTITTPDVERIVENTMTFMRQSGAHLYD